MSWTFVDRCRYLGLVRQESECKKQLLQTMMARIFKDIIRDKQREIMKGKGYPSEQPYIKIAVLYINKFFFDGEETIKFWNGALKEMLLKKFVGCLTPDEQLPTYSKKILRKESKIPKEFLEFSILTVKIWSSFRTFWLFYSHSSSLVAWYWNCSVWW